MNFNYAISQAKTEYDVTGDLEDLQEIGLIAYDKIGKGASSYSVIVEEVLKNA